MRYSKILFHPIFIFIFSIVALATSLFLYIYWYVEVSVGLDSVVRRFNLDSAQFLELQTWVVILVLSILVGIILVLALTQLPGKKLREAQQVVLNRRRSGLLRDSIISIAFGIVVMLMSLSALITRPRFSAVTPFYAANAKATGAKSIVGAILTDFRGIDTLGEITVLAVAAIGVLALMKLRDDKNQPAE